MVKGLTRRDFLAYCGRLAALLAVSETAVPTIARALEAAAGRPSVVWSSFMECGGCTIQLLQSSAPGPANLILGQISLDYQELLMAAEGDAARKRFRETVDAGRFIYVVEGAVPAKVPGAMTVAKRPAIEIVRETAPKARAVVAVGNCAAYGGVQAALPNMTGAVGVATALGSRQTGRHPDVVNIPTCPANAEAMLATLTYILVNDRLPPRDRHGRPAFLYGETIHDNCGRRAHFEQSEFVTRFGTKEEAAGFCLLPVGCKGPATRAPCPDLRWNGHRSWCVESGPCIGCAEPGFWDRLAPLSAEMRQAPTAAPAGVPAETFAAVAGGAVAIGMGSHFTGRAATDSLPWSRTRREGGTQDTAGDEPARGDGT